MGKLKNRLKVLRAEKNISQEALAKALGISRQTVIAIEGEDYSPSVALALKISEYFTVKVEDIFQLG